MVLCYFICIAQIVLFYFCQFIAFYSLLSVFQFQILLIRPTHEQVKVELFSTAHPDYLYINVLP